MSNFIKVHVGLKRTATRRSEGIEVGDTVEVTEFRPGPSPPLCGVESGLVGLKNLRTGKVTLHGSCVLGSGFLESVEPPLPKAPPPPPAPKPSFKPLDEFEITVTTSARDALAARRRLGQGHSDIWACECPVSRRVKLALKQRFRRWNSANFQVGSYLLSVKVLDDSGDAKYVANHVQGSRDVMHAFDQWATGDLPPAEVNQTFTLKFKRA